MYLWITGSNGCHDNEIIPLETFQSGAWSRSNIQLPWPQRHKVRWRWQNSCS